MTTGTSTLDELPRAIAARDFDRLERCFHPDVRMRALTPGKTHDAASPATAAALFAGWFDACDPLRLLDASVEEIRNRYRLRYRLRGVEDGRAFVVEQTAYCALAGGVIVAIDLVCSGFRADASPDAGASPVHDFDAGDLGCGTGLPGEVRRQLAAIAIGERLRIVTRDPSAREDLPALARLLGQRVLAVESSGGATTITLERAR